VKSFDGVLFVTLEYNRSVPEEVPMDFYEENHYE